MKNARLIPWLTLVLSASASVGCSSEAADDGNARTVSAGQAGAATDEHEGGEAGPGTDPKRSNVKAPDAASPGTAGQGLGGGADSATGAAGGNGAWQPGAGGAAQTGVGGGQTGGAGGGQTGVGGSQTGGAGGSQTGVGGSQSGPSTGGAGGSIDPPGVEPVEVPGGISVGLRAIEEGDTPVSFGVPIAEGTVTDAGTVRVVLPGTEEAPEGLKIKPLLYHYGPDGSVSSVRAILIQFDASVLAAGTESVDIVWDSDVGAAPPSDTAPFAETAVASDESAQVTDRIMANSNGTYEFVDTNTRTQVLFPSFEPRVRVWFPDGYLADSGILGPIMSKSQIALETKLAGLAFLGEALAAFTQSALYADGYAYAPAAVVDPVVEYEGWLYDRCATLLLAHAYEDNTQALRSAMRQCAFYASKIDGTGYYTGKPANDTKYSHARGLFAYYALTGDETARAALESIRDLWLGDPDQLVSSYGVAQKIRSITPLWTERILGTCLEGLIYGYYLDGDPTYYAAFNEVFDTAYLHITTQDAAVLQDLTLTAFPPQNCFIHSAHQHAETLGDQNTDLVPWCSGWMNELLVDALLRYRETSSDSARVDEIFIRLTRFLRDVGSTYRDGDPLGDSFLDPSMAWTPGGTRLLIPAYGAGINEAGERVLNAERSDMQHCPDTLAITSMGMAGLARIGDEQSPVGPFSSEQASFAALHQEFAHCAREVLAYASNRTAHDPRTWSSAAIGSHYSEDLAVQAEYLANQRVGHPLNFIAAGERRKYSWWFNMSMFQYKALADAGLDFSTVSAGQVQPE